MIDTSPPLRTWLVNMTNLIASAGFTLSKSPWWAKAVPKTLVDLSFSIDLQSANTLKFRDDDFLVYARHTLIVTIAKQMKPLAQFDSILEAADIEANLHEKIMPRRAMANTVITWLSTRRILTPSREHMLLYVTYRCDVDFVTGATPQE